MMRWHCLQLACQWPNNKITINVRRWHWHHCTADGTWWEKIKLNNPEENNQPCRWQLEKNQCEEEGWLPGKNKKINGTIYENNLAPLHEAQVGILDAQVVMLFYFFCNMQRIKINLCAEVTAFFFIAWKKLSFAIVRDMAMCASGICVPKPRTWMLSLPQVFYFIFYFWLRDGKNYKMYFSSWKELENL